MVGYELLQLSLGPARVAGEHVVPGRLQMPSLVRRQVTPLRRRKDVVLALRELRMARSAAGPEEDEAQQGHGSTAAPHQTIFSR
jgi:hypothetical protein